MEMLVISAELFWGSFQFRVLIGVVLFLHQVFSHLLAVIWP